MAKKFKNLDELYNYWKPFASQAKPMPEDEQIIGIKDLGGPFNSYLRVGMNGILRKALNHGGFVEELVFTKRDGNLIQVYSILPLNDIKLPNQFIHSHDGYYLIIPKEITHLPSENYYWEFPKDGTFKVYLKIHRLFIEIKNERKLNTTKTGVYFHKHSEMNLAPPVEDLRRCLRGQLSKTFSFNPADSRSIEQSLINSCLRGKNGKS